MMFTGVHLDPETKRPVRWRVENSWGPEACNKVRFSPPNAFTELELILTFASRRASSSCQTSGLPRTCSRSFLLALTSLPSSSSCTIRARSPSCLLTIRWEHSPDAPTERLRVASVGRTLRKSRYESLSVNLARFFLCISRARGSKPLPKPSAPPARSPKARYLDQKRISLL